LLIWDKVMQTLRENWAFIVLALFAILLVILFIRLQNAILAVMPPQAQTSWQAVSTAVPLSPTLSLPTATFTARLTTPTSTLTQIPVLARPTITPTSVPTWPPTYTPIPIVLPTIVQEVTPTPNSQAVGITSTATGASQSAVGVAQEPRANYRLGYLERGDNCVIVATILQRILEQEFNQTIEMVAFTQVDELFRTLAEPNAESRIDLTPCYIDPDDRDYLPQHFGFIIFVAGVYGKLTDKNHLLVSNGSVKKILQREQPCLYKFLKEFRINDTNLQGVDAAAWIANHNALIRSWITCQ
jgi:hypothetical protein